MRLITAIGCCLLLAIFITANADVSHLKYSRRPYKKLTTTTSIPNTKSDTIRKESTYSFKPKVINRKGLRHEKLTTMTTMTTEAQSVATQSTSTTQAPTSTSTSPATPTTTSTLAETTPTTTKPTIVTTENDDSISVINNSDSIRDGDVKRSERDGKSLQDAWDIRHNIPGEPGVDYPIYFEAPDSKFDCENRHDGYYADIEARCQVFHVCANTALEERGFIFLCPNGTVFSQEHFVCDWYTNVDCPQSEKYYYKNEELGRFIGSKEEMLLEVQKMFNYTLRNLLNSRTTSNENGASISGSTNGGGDGNSIADDQKSVDDQKIDNFPAIPILNPKMRKPGNKTKTNSKTAKDEVYISNLGELSTDPGADFDIEVVKMQAKLKSEAANRKKAGSFSELWGQDIDQLDAILSQNRLKKSSDGNQFIEATDSTPHPSTVTKRDVSHLLTTPEYLPPNRYLPSLRKINLRPQTGYQYELTSPVTLTDTITTTENYINDSTRRTRPTTTKRVYARRPTPTKTTIVTPVTETTTVPVGTKRRPSFKLDVTDKPESLLDYRGNFQTTDKVRGDQKPDEDFYDDVVDFESRKENPISQSSTNEITNEPSLALGNDIETTTKITTDVDNSVNALFVLSTTIKNEPASIIDDEGKTNYPFISSTVRNSLDDTISFTKETKTMKRPIILLMPPYKINRTMDEKQQMTNILDSKPTKTNLNQNSENIMVVFASGKNTADLGETTVAPNKFIIDAVTEKEIPIEIGLKANTEKTIQTTPQILEDANELNTTNDSGSILLLPPFGNGPSTVSSLNNEIEQTGDRDYGTVRISTQIIDLEDQDLDDILIDPEQLNIRIRPEVVDNESPLIESTTVRIGSGTNVELSQLEEVQTNNRDDRLALIQKMIKILEQKMKLKLGNLPDISTETPSVVTSRLVDTTTTPRPVTQFSLDNIIREKDTTQSQGVGANLIFAMMKILEDAQNKTKTGNVRPGDGSVLQPIFSSLTNAQTESPISIRDEDILNNEDILSKTINLLQNSDDDELKSILEVNEIEKLRKNGNFILVDKSSTTQEVTGTTGKPEQANKNRFEMNTNPSIRIKEVFRDGNNNVKLVDQTVQIIDNRVNEPAPVTFKPVIKSTFDSQSINRLSESFPIISKSENKPPSDPQTIRIVEPVPQNVFKFTFGTQIDNGPNDQSDVIRISEARPMNEPQSRTVVETTNFDVTEPSLAISKTRIAEVAPTRASTTVTLKPIIKTAFDSQQIIQMNEMPEYISKTRVSDVTPLNQPLSVVPTKMIKTTVGSQQNVNVDDSSLSISKTRVAEVEPLRQPTTAIPNPTIKTVFESQKIQLGTGTPQSISTTRISDDASLNRPTSIVTKTIIETKVDSQDNTDLDDSSLAISKTRVAQVEPTREPLKETIKPIIKTAFDSQQINRVTQPQSTPKTIISEVSPLNTPSSVTSTTFIKTAFDSQQNDLDEPSITISKTRIAQVEPQKEPSTVPPILAVKTKYDSEQFNTRTSQPMGMISTTRISHIAPINEPSSISNPLVKFSFGTQIDNDDRTPSEITQTSEITMNKPSVDTIVQTIFNSRQNNIVIDPSLDISKTRIAQVDPTIVPSTVTPKMFIETSFKSQTGNTGDEPMLAISKTRLAEIAPTQDAVMVISKPAVKTSFETKQNIRGSDSTLSISKNRIAEVVPVSGPYPKVVPQIQFSFGEEINNLVNEPSSSMSNLFIKSLTDQQETRINQATPEDAQIPVTMKTVSTSPVVTPKPVQVVDEKIVQSIFDSKHTGIGSTIEPMIITTLNRADGGISKQKPQTVPETHHKVVEIIDQDTPDLDDTEVGESDTNVRVEGKFTGFLNNNPDQKNLGVKSKGYVYENKLSPEVLKIYNINDIDERITTFQPNEPVTKSTSGSPFKVIVNNRDIKIPTPVTVLSSTRLDSSSPTTPTAGVTSTLSTTTPKPVVITTSTTPKPQITTTKVLTTRVPNLTTKVINTATVSKAPLVIRVEDTSDKKQNSVNQISETREVFIVSNPNPLPVTSRTTTKTTSPTSPTKIVQNITPTVLPQKTSITTRTQETVTPSPQIRPQITIKTQTQQTVSTSQQRPQIDISNNPTLTVHQNLLKQLPGITITPSISQSLGQVVTQSRVNTERPVVTSPAFTVTQSFGTEQAVSQYPIPLRSSATTTQKLPQQQSFVATNTPFRQVTERPVQQQTVAFPNQQVVFGLQDGQAKRPVQEQNRIVFNNQRPQVNQNTNQLIQTQQGNRQLPGAQRLNQPYETPLLIDRPGPEPVISSQFPFGTEQQVSFNNDQNAFRPDDSVIVNIVPSINWYLNDAQDRNSYFNAIQRGLISTDNINFNQGHLRYGVPSVFQNQNTFGQQQNNYQNAQIERSHYTVLGAQEHARQSEFPIPNINHIPLGAHMARRFLHQTGRDYVENSNRRADDSNTIHAFENDDSVFRGISSYNAPLASVGKLPCDSDSVSGAGH